MMVDGMVVVDYRVLVSIDTVQTVFRNESMSSQTLHSFDVAFLTSGIYFEA